MTITLPYLAKLQHAITSDQTEIILTGDTTDLCNCINAPSHIFATIYTASKSETILIYDCNGVDIVVTRGVSGSEPLDWPAGGCFKVDLVVDGAVCPDTDPGNDDACHSHLDVFGNELWDGTDCDGDGHGGGNASLSEANLGKGLTINRDNPLAPVLEVAATGVVPGTYGGAEVNACGQIVSLPPNWPASALPVFNPCCDDVAGGGGGAVAAIDVSFNPQPGSTIATGNNVQLALQQIDDYLTNFVVPDSGVQSLTAGDCITITGTAADPIISVTPTGITAGVYAGFTVNDCGQIVSYNPVADTHTQIIATAPLNALYAPGTNTYTLSIGQATKTEHGTVELADEGNLGGNENLIDGDDAITWDFLQQWANGAAGVGAVTASLPGLLVTYNGVDTYDITPAPDLVNADGNPIVVVYDAATGKFQVDIIPAGVGQFGAVQLADPANAGNPVANNPEDVVTSQYLEDWKVANGL